MKATNIYLCGVGGQGIGLLSEVMIRACMAAGYEVMGVDTHGLAQRGGTVVSHLRIGARVFTPMVPPGEADIVIAMERLEGLRGAMEMLKRGGTLIYYNTVQQPLKVRSGQAEYPSEEAVEDHLRARSIRIEKVHVPGLPDARMQNVALLGRFANLNMIEGLGEDVLRETLLQVVPPHASEANLAVFEKSMNAL